MNIIKFTKMQGLGNDFMVIDDFEKKHMLSPDLIQQWSDRKTGVGFDQLLCLKPTPDYAAHYQIFNANGDEVEQCGNGARCVAKYLWDRQLVLSKKMLVVTQKQELSLYYRDDNHIEVNMGKATLVDLDYKVNIADKMITGVRVDLANPHWILFEADLNVERLQFIGEKAQQYFPTGMNVSFVKRLNENTLHLKTYERGVGLTDACGSAACAAVNAMQQQAQFVTVHMQRGALQIKINPDETTLMVGAAREVYRGEINVH